MTQTNSTDLEDARIVRLRPEDVPCTLSQLPPSISGLRLPYIPSGVTWLDLKLKVRTENCVRKLAANPDGLSGISIGQLGRLWGFGRSSLFDLLNAIRAVRKDVWETTLEALPKEVETQVPGGAPAPHIDVGALRAISGDIRPSAAGLTLPKLPDGVTWDDLRLQVRTEKRVRKLANTPSELHKLKVGDLIRMSGFGRHSLSDLLTAMSTIRQPADEAAEQETDESKHAVAPHGGEHVRSASLETELAKLLEVMMPARHRASDRTISARYLGWDGRGGATLQQVGQEHGITRERVRQICSRPLERLARKPPLTPVLDRVLSMIEGSARNLATDIELDLVSLGLTAQPFRLEGILKIAQQLGRETRVLVREIGHQRVVVRSDQEKLQARALQLARRSARRWGAATVSDIGAQLESEVSKPAENSSPIQFNQAVTAVLRTQGDFRWLDETRGWFWFIGFSGNPLFTRIRKVLAVAGSVSVSELRTAISRDRRMRGFCPPRGVLAELCSQAQFCIIDDVGRIATKPTAPAEEVLSANERLLMQILRGKGPLLECAKLEELCLSAGMARPTFWAMASGSSIVMRYAPRVYGLVGLDIQPGVVESIAPIRQSNVLVDYGWLPGGQIWLGYKLSRGMVRNGVFGVPTAMKKFLEGEYALVAADGAKLGILIVRESNGRGLGPFYKRRGGEPGDCLVVQFDRGVHRAVVSVGQEELLEEYARSAEGAKESD